MKKVFKRIFITLGIIAVLATGYFFLILKLDKNVMEAGDFYPAASNALRPVLLPSFFLNGERFYLKLPAKNGDTLLCFGDSGGGISMALPATISRLNLGNKVRHGMFKGIMPLKYILFGDMFKGSDLPAPVAMRHMQLHRPFAAEKAPFLLIPPEDEELKQIGQIMKLDVFLGQNFFMGKAWTIDYPKRQLWAFTPIQANELGKPGVQKLGFKKNVRGEKTYGHPSLPVEVDRELIDMLFDTGATIILSDSGKSELHNDAASIGGSFIARSIFDKWRQKHPEWNVYKAADHGRDVIEVPQIKLGGYSVGPVLFAKRDDEQWSQGMIHTMDKVVKGAVGGSALKYLRVVIDYNSELIKFEQ